MSMMPIGMVVYGMLYDTLPATIILPVTSIIIIIISLVMLRSSILKEAHPEYYEKQLYQKGSRTQQRKEQACISLHACSLLILNDNIGCLNRTMNSNDKNHFDIG